MDRYNDLAEIDLDEMRRRGLPPRDDGPLGNGSRGGAPRGAGPRNGGGPWGGSPRGGGFRGEGRPGDGFRGDGFRGDGPPGDGFRGQGFGDDEPRRPARNFGESPRMAQPRPAGKRGPGGKAPGRRNRSRFALTGGPRGRGPKGPTGPGGPGGPEPGQPRRRKILKWTSIATTIVLVSASLVAYAAYRDVFDGVRQVNVSDLLGKRPPEFTSAQNILVIGSDSRAGTRGQFGSAQTIAGARSDTMMLLHILPQHQGGVVVSFPRDSVVPIIACKADGIGDPGQKASPGATEMLNATFAAGGAPCLWKTLEAETGIFINHFVEINFSGFQSVVNDLGGVNVCLPEAIKDPASGLNLTAGLHHVNGAQALAFVRERHIGEGSDLQRIQRQQFFMASLLQQIDSKNALANVTQLFAIARDVAKTLTTDSGLTASNMITLAQSMKGLTSKAVQFTQVPVVQDPTDANRVEWTQPQAAQLFSDIAHDQSVAKKPAARPKASAPASRPGTAGPKVGVKVLNATGTGGLAKQTATSLTQQRYRVTSTGNAPAPSASTIIQYSAASDAAGARALAQIVPNAVVEQVAGVTTGTVDLIIGSNFSGVKSAASSAGTPAATGSPTSSSSSSSPNIGNVTKNFGGITGNTNICRDSGAFTGPDVPADFAP